MTDQEARDELRDAVAKAMCAIETRSRAATLEEVQKGIQRWTRHRYEAERLIEELADYGVLVRKHPEPEWEYGAGYQGDNGREVLWFSLAGGAFTVREAAEHEVARFNDPQVRLIRRVRPGPWLPVEDTQNPNHTDGGA